ncbi:MAG TPA: hypothetical protein VF846_13060 [Thermoanaerobaculia bacterium]
MTEKLYRALFQISTLRDEVRALRCESGSVDDSRFLMHLDVLEAAAVSLIDCCGEPARKCH